MVYDARYTLAAARSGREISNTRGKTETVELNVALASTLATACNRIMAILR